MQAATLVCCSLTVLRQHESAEVGNQCHGQAHKLVSVCKDARFSHCCRLIQAGCAAMHPDVSVFCKHDRVSASMHMTPLTEPLCQFLKPHIA